MKILYIFILIVFLSPFTFLRAQMNDVVAVKSNDEIDQADKLQREKEKLQREKDHILSLEEKWLFAEIKMDTTLISSLIDADYMGISEYGVYSKQDELRNIFFTMEDRKKNNISIDTFEIENGVVNLYDNTAIVTFIMLSYRNESGIIVLRKTRFYDVWVKKEGRWLAVSSQGSVVKE